MLTNGSFESSLDGWTIYHRAAPAQANIESRADGAQLVFDGDHSLRFLASYQMIRSGAYQQVTVPPGSLLRAAVTGYLLAGSPDPQHNLIHEIYSAVRVGIDPAGGTDPAGAGVKWGSVGGDTQAVTATVQDAAETETVTVFVEVQIGQDWPPTFAVGILDGVTLDVTPPAGAAAPSAPATPRRITGTVGPFVVDLVLS